MKIGKTLAAMMLMVLLHLCTQAQEYAMQTRLIGTLASFDISLATNDVMLRGIGLPLRLNFDGKDVNAPTNILSISAWDGTNKVAEYSGPLMPLDFYRFMEDLRRRDYGLNILDLQIFFNLDPRTILGISGPGSPGQETITFGGKTEAALMNWESIHNLFLDDGSLSLVLDEQDRNYINNLELEKNHEVVFVPFTTNVAINAGATKVLQLVFKTTPGWRGKFTLDLADTTDHQWDAEYTTGDFTGTIVTENYNPTGGVEISAPPLTPQLSIHRDYLQIISSPGDATLRSTSDFKDWKSEKISLSKEGITFIPFSPTQAEAQFFQVSQP